MGTIEQSALGLKSELHQAALAYAAAAIPIFPIVPGSKEPACANGFYDATTDAAQINAWWSAQPDLNIGVCPEDAGWLVVDIDPGAEPIDLPVTYTVRTPRGGTHHYFAGSGPSTVSKLAPHIDTRGRRGFIVAPPSMVDGKAYEVIDDRAPAPLPTDLGNRLGQSIEPRVAAVEELDLPGNIARARTLLTDLVERGDVAIEGQGGNARTYELACELRDLGLSADKSIELIETIWNPNCAPPWPREELAVIVINAESYAQNEAGANALVPVQEVFGEVITEYVERPRKLINPVPFSNLLSRPTKPVEELIPGLIEKGIATMLAGRGSTHKSRVALQWGLALQAGVPVFGKPVEQCTFVYFDYENGEEEITRRIHKMQARLNLANDITGQYQDFRSQAAATDNPLPPNNVSPPLAVIHDAGVEPLPFYYEMYAYLRSIPGHKFVVADSCYNILRFTGQTKIDEAAVKAALGLLDYLCAATDSTMLYLWHPSQAGQDRGDASGWSVAWHNTPRARLSLSRVQNAKDAFTLRVEKRNNGPEGAELTLYWSDGILLPRSEVDTAQQSSLFFEACISVASLAAEQGDPITKQRKLLGWQLEEIERSAGFRPAQGDVKDQLARAVGLGRLRYVSGYGKQKAGYFPLETNPVMLRQTGIDTAPMSAFGQ